MGPINILPLITVWSLAQGLLRQQRTQRLVRHLARQIGLAAPTPANSSALSAGLMIFPLGTRAPAGPGFARYPQRQNSSGLRAYTRRDDAAALSARVAS
jgi:hypothetical protein